MQYVWFIWSLIILALWAIIYLLRKESRKEMLKMSLITMPFGLTEPLFVPEYWFPPSLFNLAIKTGFDIESLIFSFAIGGIGTVLYNLTCACAGLFYTCPIYIAQPHLLWDYRFVHRWFGNTLLPSRFK